MGKRPAEVEQFEGNMGSIQREDSTYRAASLLLTSLFARCHRRRHLSNHRTYGLLFRHKTLTTAQSLLTHKGLPRLIAYYTYRVVE